MGDILVTHRENIQFDYITPSFINGTKNIFNQIERKPHSFKQKLYIVNDQLCIGLGGNLNQMYSFLQACRAYFSHTVPSKLEFIDFIDHYPKEKRNRLIGFAILATPDDSTEWVHFFVSKLGGCETLPHKYYQSILACGSGATEYLHQMSNSLTDIQELGAGGELQFALQQNLMGISRILTLELINGKTLKEAWGVGFEMVYFASKSFRKVNNITFVFVLSTYNSISGKVEGDKIINAVKYYYHNDFQVIRSFKEDKELGFIISTIDHEPNDYEKLEFPWLDYDSQFNVVSFIVRLPNGKYYISHSVVIKTQLGLKNSNIVYDGNGSVLSISMNEKMKENLEEWIKSKGLNGLGGLMDSEYLDDV